MASSGVGAIRIIDASGDPCDNDSGALKVVLSASDDINIGNVVLQSDAGNDVQTKSANSDSDPDLDNLLLLGTHALLSARSDSSTTCGITCENSTHNALHVAISDGAGIASVNGDGALSVDISGALQSEDDEHTSGDKGFMSLAIRNDTLAALGGADGDYAPLQVNSNGALHVSIFDDTIYAGIGWAQNRSMPTVPSVRKDTLAHLVGVNSGDLTHLCVDSIGGLYVTGSEVENAAVQSEPLLIGGRYDSSARTLGDGDAGAAALNASGHMIVDVVDGGQLDTIIDTLETTLTAIETDQAAIETLLTGIDADTDAIKTAVQILDDWDDSNYANVNINLAGSDAPTGGGAESGALRVTLANDSTGVISIDDGGNTITVDGTVDLGSTATTHLSEIESAVENIESILKVEDVAHLSGTGGIAPLAVRNDELAGLSSNDNDYSVLQVDAQGALYTTHGITGLASDDNDTVGTSAEKISGADGDVACKRVDIMAHPDNTGYIWIGDGAVTTNGLNGGIRLAPGDFYSLDIDNTGDVYAIATVDGENACFNYFT